VVGGVEMKTGQERNKLKCKGVNGTKCGGGKERERETDGR